MTQRVAHSTDALSDDQQCATIPWCPSLAMKVKGSVHASKQNRLATHLVEFPQQQLECGE
jgi:hypothetical protein